MDLYHLTSPTVPAVPIVISSPHSGIYFPENIKSRLKPGMAERPDDADWFIEKLYDFAPSMGITLISAHCCRWVIDLNRDPNSMPLYDDGRVITGLVPLTDFNGNPLYDGNEPDAEEIRQRVADYYIPYHKKVEELLRETQSKFGKALLFDAHSIRKRVPGICKEAFPDLILGDNDLTSASAAIIEAAFGVLAEGGYELEHNKPFKGGYITRYFGRPQQNCHALQLEMAKTNYMDDAEREFHPQRAQRIRTLLKNMFSELIHILNA